MAAVSQHAMRRHPGGALDPSSSFTSSYYALAHHQQVLSPDKSKKTWSQLFKLSKSDKLLNGYTEPLDLTTTSTNTLSRPMKYAEPWLYGTIRGIPAPLIHRQQMIAQYPEVAVMVCSCAEYLNGTKREQKKATICKKCHGSRLPLTTIGRTVQFHSTPPLQPPSISHIGGQQISIGTTRMSSFNNIKQRPSILNRENDPYDMMRRSRLISPEISMPAQKVFGKNRAKSSSPSRGRSRNRKRSPSPTGQLNRCHRSRSATRTDGWINENDMLYDSGQQQRSILQSDLNAYELITSKSTVQHMNEFSPQSNYTNEDSLYKRHCQKYEHILNNKSFQNINSTITAAITTSTISATTVVASGKKNKFLKKSNSDICENNDKYEDVIFPSKNGTLSLNRTNSVSPSQSVRRKKPDVKYMDEVDQQNITSLKAELILTTESLSIISNDITQHPPINTIKPILKRPTSITSDLNGIDQQQSLNSKSLSLPGNNWSTIDQTTVNKNRNIGKLQNGKYTNNSIDNGIKYGKDKRNSGSHFYLPMPQRKKVQFLMENEIIENSNVDKCEQYPNDQHLITSSTTTFHNIQHCDQKENSNNVILKCNDSDDTTTVSHNKDSTSNNCHVSNANDDISTNFAEDNDIPFRKNTILRRTLSERRLTDKLTPKPENISFIDTTALRNKSYRSDSRSIFNESLQCLRPKDPPPPPPPSSFISNASVQLTKKLTPTRPPRQSNRKPSKINDIDQSNGVKLIINNNNNNNQNPENTIKISEQNDETDDKIGHDENTEQRKRIQANIEAFQGSRLFSQTASNKKTIVKVAPLIINKESPAIHRLEIRNDCNDSMETSKKTSIMINGDDCYSTINVNDNTRLYQSSVVVNDNSIGTTISQSNSNTVSISVTSYPATDDNIVIHHQPDHKTMSIIPIENTTKVNCNINNDSTLSTNSGHTKTTIILDFDENPIKDDHGKNEILSIDSPATDTNDKDLLVVLRNPVEAIKRNLIPHVCGKTNAEDLLTNKTMDKIKSSTEKRNECKYVTEKWLQTENSSFIAKLLEDPTLGHLAEGLDNDLVAKLIESSLVRLKESRNNIELNGTKDEKDMNKMIDISLQKVKEERVRLENCKLSIDQEKIDDHEKYSLSSGNSYSSANYEPYDFDNNDLSDYYQSCSSEITVDDDGNLIQSKFYQMLVDATLSEIEITTNNDDDHHYESIRMNGDPIYEEINDVPPPLPLCPPPNDLEMEKKMSKSMFEGASKYDILSYLVDAKERGLVQEDSYMYNFSNTADIIIEEQADKVAERLHNRQNSDLSSRISQLSNISDMSDESSLKLCAQRKTSTEIERNDSGVGSETSKTSRSKYQYLPGSILNKNSPIHLCEDCDGQVETQITDSGVMFAPLVCRKCCKKRAERKEIVMEIIETEEKYSRDLQIILEEFYNPMLVAGLLTQDQLSTIFLNCEELLENSQSLADKMRDAFDIAIEQGDDDLLTVNIGKLMLDAAPMLHAFESYCIRQAAASLLLANMEKEKELLRIFLRVSQMENAVLRRMNLNSFLMVPVQRVTKYPLLLARLYKVTPSHVDGKELLKQAQEKIELHLNHMNREAKDVPTKLWRRISSSSPGRRSSCEIDMINIKLRKMAMDLLEWHLDEVKFAMEGKLLFTQPTDNNWRKGRTIKLSPVNALLVTNGKPTSTYKIEKILGEQINFPRHTGIREAALLMVREKSSRYTLVREPLFLDRCIVCTESDWEDYFEVQEIATKDTFIFKAEDGTRTKLWYTQLQYHAQGMGAWRKRRNALANIMINGMMMRS